MKLKHILSLTILTTLVFTSCKNKEYASNLKSNTTIKSNIIINSRIALLEDTIKGFKKEIDSLSAYKKKTVSGKLIFGLEVATFQPCGSDKVFWINDKTKSGRLEKLYHALVNVKEPYTPISAKIEIIDKGKEKYGFATNYDGTYQVVNVLKINQIIKNNCK